MLCFFLCLLLSCFYSTFLKNCFFITLLIIIVDNKLCNNRDNRTYDPVKISMSASNTNSNDPTAAQANSMMNMMTYGMPLMSLFICINLPIAIGLYWIIGSVISQHLKWNNMNWN